MVRAVVGLLKPVTATISKCVGIGTYPSSRFRCWIATLVTWTFPALHVWHQAIAQVMTMAACVGICKRDFNLNIFCAIGRADTSITDHDKNHDKTDVRAVIAKDVLVAGLEEGNVHISIRDASCSTGTI